MNGLQLMRDRVLVNYLQLRAPLLLLDLDGHGVVQEANQFARTLLGDSCIGSPIELLAVNFQNRIDMAALRSQRPNTLMSFRGGGGTPVSLLVSFLPLGTAGLLVGTPDQQETEELHGTLLRLNSELSVISRELQRKTAQLERANELKNQFLGMAAHDLRNPLAGIYAYLDLLLEEHRSSGQETPLFLPLTEILREVEYMLNLVSNLLDFSVIEQGRLDLAPQEVDAGQLLQQVVQLNSLLATKRHVRITLRISDDPGTVTMDLNRMRQVLNNLLSNAAKFSPPGGEVTVALSRRDADLLLQISDQGPGVPVAERERLFTPFGKTSARAPSGDKSTGLGLSICKKIVEAHGGRIWEENLPQGGACFSFTLPAGTPGQQHQAPSTRRPLP